MSTNNDFTSQDIASATEALRASEASNPTVKEFDPSLEISLLLSSLLHHRIKKIQDDELEEAYVQNIIARMPEASFNDLVHGLNSLHSNRKDEIEKLLEPFIPRDNGVNLLNQSAEKDKTTIKEMGDTATKETLQALAELPKLLGRLPQLTEDQTKTMASAPKSDNNASKAEETADIKKALMES